MIAIWKWTLMVCALVLAVAPVPAPCADHAQPHARVPRNMAPPQLETIVVTNHILAIRMTGFA